MSGVYTVPNFGPSDLLTSNVEGERRVKVDAEITGPPITIDSVTVGNFPTVYPDQHVQPLTDAQLRAAPVQVAGELTTTPSGTQDVNIVASNEIEVTLNGEQIALTRGDSNSNPLFVGWSGTQKVAVQGSVQVVTQGSSSLSVNSSQDGEWDVSVDNFPATQTVDGTIGVDNFPAEYPLPDAQVSALTPQTDALTDQQLRAAPIEVSGSATGAWDYVAGTSGTVSVAGRVLMISAMASTAGGSISINVGDSIPIPSGRSVTIEPKGNLASPSIAFTGTSAYLVEFVT